MIAVHECASPTRCAESAGSGSETIEPLACPEALSSELGCPRSIEILTVLNEVFDSFGVAPEADMLDAAATV